MIFFISFLCFAHLFLSFPISLVFLLYFLLILLHVYPYGSFLLFIWVDFLFARTYFWLIFLPFFHTVVVTYLFSLGCYILTVNFCLFHFAVIQGEEWNGAYSKEIEEGKGSAGLCASCVKMSCVFSPHSEGAWTMVPFHTGIKRSYKGMQTISAPFSSVKKLLLRELGDVSYCGFPLYTYKPDCKDFYFLKNWHFPHRVIILSV